MQEKTLNIDSGLIAYHLNDACTVCFNPSDFSFASKVYTAFEDLEKRAEDYKKQIAEANSARESMELGKKLDNEMRDVINWLFGDDICTPLFGSVNVYAMSDGMPLWANLMLAIIDEMDTQATEQGRLQKEKIAKYTKKYKR